MKAQDLRIPFDWESRHVFLKDQLLYVPCYYENYRNFAFPGWEHCEVFGNDHPVHVEYCSGNGEWIVAKAAAEPNINWVAVEKKFERASKIWARAKRQNLTNILIVCGDALTATKHYFPTESISHAYINFPDPWPKKRHAKHRLVQDDFTYEVWRILKNDCNFSLVTDDPNYSQQMISVMIKNSGFETNYPTPYFITNLPGYGTSYFEDLWREQGKIIKYHQFRKKALRAL